MNMGSPQVVVPPCEHSRVPLEACTCTLGFNGMGNCVSSPFSLSASRLHAILCLLSLFAPLCATGGPECSIELLCVSMTVCVQFRDVDQRS